MGLLIITCPKTGEDISTGIETDKRSFLSLPDMLAHSHCPFCGLEHAWWKHDARLVDDMPIETRIGNAD